MLSASLAAFVTLVLASLPASGDAAVTRAGEPGECSGLPQHIYEREQEEVAKADPEAEAMLELIGRAEACVDEGLLEDEGGRLTVWLLNNRVYWLVEADQYEEAGRHVERFFAAYAAEADSAFVAKMHAWRIELAALQGRVHEGVSAYAEALPYRTSLRGVEQVRLDLDGAYLFLRLGQHAFAGAKAEEAERAISALLRGVAPTEVPDEVKAELARARHLQAEAMLAQDPRASAGLVLAERVGAEAGGEGGGAGADRADVRRGGRRRDRSPVLRRGAGAGPRAWRSPRRGPRPL